MVTLNDVLHKIANDVLHSNDGGVRYDFNMSITSDVATTEAEFTTEYGAGKNYNFPLENKAHGKALAVSLYKYLTGKDIDLPATGSMTESNEQLFLYVHLSPMLSK